MYIVLHVNSFETHIEGVLKPIRSPTQLRLKVTLIHDILNHLLAPTAIGHLARARLFMIIPVIAASGLPAFIGSVH